MPDKHVIAYKLVGRTDDRANHEMAAVMEEFGATKMKRINTLWTVPSHGRDSKAICSGIRRLARSRGVSAKKVHIWAAKYDPNDKAYGKFKV